MSGLSFAWSAAFDCIHLHLVARPAKNAVVAADTLQSAKADAEILGSLLYGDVEVLLELWSARGPLRRCT